VLEAPPLLPNIAALLQCLPVALRQPRLRCLARALVVFPPRIAVAVTQIMPIRHRFCALLFFGIFVYMVYDFVFDSDLESGFGLVVAVYVLDLILARRRSQEIGC
jgi:hypothetical protein